MQDAMLSTWMLMASNGSENRAGDTNCELSSAQIARREASSPNCYSSTPGHDFENLPLRVWA